MRKTLLLIIILNLFKLIAFGQNKTNDIIKVFQEIDSTKLNNSFIDLAALREPGVNCYYKIGDDIKWSNDTIITNWSNGIFTNDLITLNDKKTIVKEIDGNIWYLYPIKISPDLLNKPLCIYYTMNAAFEIYINGKLFFGKGKIATNNKDELILSSQGFFFVSFNKPVNYISARISNHTLKNKLPTTLLALSNDKQLTAKIALDNFGHNLGIGISIFYLAFFIIYFILFISDKRSKVYLYFSLFCFLMFTNFLNQALFNNVENYQLKYILFGIVTSVSPFILFTALCFLHCVVFGNLKKYLRWLLIICFAVGIYYFFENMPFFQNNIYLQITVASIILPIYIFYSVFEAIRVCIIGFKRKIGINKSILYGIIICVSILLISSIFQSILLSPDAFGTVTFITMAQTKLVLVIGFASIPISFSVALINNFVKTGKSLEKQLILVTELSEKSIQQEKEKQKILETQNEVLEEQVTLRTAEVVAEKQVVEAQKHLVEEKNREITDSIEYALRIQTAILPPNRIVKQYLENSFILYKPKDIVAGDFYWMETVKDLVLFAACDCTGHGVPGAMVSVVCNNALNRAVREFGFTQPAAILDKAAEIVLENFSKSEEEIQDGMDISICALNTKTKTLEWAGANNPLWLISNGNLIETKADKQCIGYNDNVKLFTNHQFNLQPNTSIYLFTDGFSDQFGGPLERKLTKNRFRELLLSIQHLTIQQQAAELDEFILNYKKETDQTDDILVIGVRV